MSDSLMALNPRMEEPSKARPSVNLSSVSAVAGIEKAMGIYDLSQFAPRV